MILFIVSFLSCIAFSAEIQPTAFPVFLKQGFSSVLEFDDVPVKVVIGDSQNFQVEKLDHSLVLKTLNPYAASNMFVYFANKEPRLFVLTASEDAEPTYYRKFQNPILIPKQQGNGSHITLKRGARLLTALFDGKKDYLTVEIEISADSKDLIKPNWGNVRLSSGKSIAIPYKLWAQRQEVQKDSRIKARFIFAKPNIPKNLVGVTLIIPLNGSPTPFTIALGRSLR